MHYVRCGETMRLLIFRSGAFGDMVILTPVLRYLHSNGNELVVVTGKRGMEVVKNNPHIYKLIQWKEETPVEQMDNNLKHISRQQKCDKIHNFSESIEVSLSQHPRSPNYKLPKYERFARFNRNFYEHAFEHIGLDWHGIDLLPELFFTEQERKQAKERTKDGCFNILMGLSGSGNNKTWPWSQDFSYRLCDEFPNVHIITVGDEKCRLIEPERVGRITNFCGKITMREAMALTECVQLVIAPDTGIIHAAGCFDTPKVCLLGHNTKECITKYFKNDFSLEADPVLAPCAPCFYLIYNMKLQCPIAEHTGSYCMENGLPLDRVYNHVKGLIC